jgi:Family of unknown function (DUF5519)
MANLVENFTKTVSQWEQVAATPHRFGGTEFNIGKVEIGHIHHSNGMVDIPFTVKVREVLVAEGLAGYHHLLTDSGWITYFVRDENSLQHAIWLMRLSYLQKASRRSTIDSHEIESMNLSSNLKQAAFPKSG